ncbi:XRE family transcriptional regulator [Staphylococcus cohnii]|nr:XRE family transcriptional regulator [Staphylococcus cohnii]
MRDFENFVRKELKKRDVSQQQLAWDLGISAPYLSDILNKRRKAPKQRDRILEYLNKKPIKEEQNATAGN